MHRPLFTLLAFLLLLPLLLAQATPPITGPTTAPPVTPPTTPPTTQPGGGGVAVPFAGGRIGIVLIQGEIYDFTVGSVQRRTQQAIDDGADIIVYELDTPGGYMTSAMAISKYIKSLRGEGVSTVAWVHPNAYSGGTLIAAACDTIVMSPASSMGDSAPITGLGNLAPTERAKALSPLLSEYKDSARQNGYDYAVLHAMCVLGVDLYLIRNPETGERVVVNQVDYDWMVNARETPVALPGSVGGGPGIFGPGPVSMPPMPVPGGGGGGTSGGGGGGGVTAIEAEGGVVRVVGTDADRGKWVPVETLPGGGNAPGGRVHEGSLLFTPDQTLAAAIGLSSATLRNEAEVQRHFAASGVQRYDRTWSENLADFLTNGWVRAILIVMLLVGLFIEFQAPGLGIGGLLALVATAILFGAPFLIGLAHWWHILLFIAGLVLLVIELAFTPTFGLLGILGLLMAFAGLVLAVVPTGTGPGWAGQVPATQMWGAMVRSSLWTLLAVILGGVAFFFLAKHYGSVPLLNRLILQDAEPTGPGPAAHVSGDDAVGGRIGVAVGDAARVTGGGLRPSGRVQLGDGRVVDVVAVTGYIEPGTAVSIIEVRGNRIVVEPLTA